MKAMKLLTIGGEETSKKPGKNILGLGGSEKKVLDKKSKTMTNPINTPKQTIKRLMSSKSPVNTKKL